MIKNYFGFLVFLALVFGSFVSFSNRFIESYPIPTVIQNIVNKIYDSNDIERFSNITQKEILEYIDIDSKDILSSQYWVFDVNTDVEVFVCRDVKQQEVPFWLLEDFTKTNLFIRNENVEYEVWSKIFKRGQVQLGINGFDRHRYTYFVLVKALSPASKIEIKPVWPVTQSINTLSTGSVIYNDWDELVVTSYSPLLANSYILSTSRGRSREAHLINAFRHTDYPSSLIPDQVLFSWMTDPSDSQFISWRTSNKIKECSIQYWKEGTTDTITLKVNSEVIHDVLLYNDPIIKRFGVNLTSLYSNSIYGFQIISDGRLSEKYTFRTANSNDDFEFGWFGDMHNDIRLGKYIPKWRDRFPNANFYLQVGDLVNTGLYRDHWDQLLFSTKSITDYKSFMAVPGNHDSQEALFPWMYLSFLKYPSNGPNTLQKGLTYSFVYNNTLFLMLDAVTFGAKEQEKWIEEQLAASKETFKIVGFHFAPHTFESTYDDIIESWEPLFVKYDVDLVFNGHFHYYHRTNNKHRPKYIMSVATNGKGENITVKGGDLFKQKGYLYQHVKVGKKDLELISVDTLGTVIDQFKITKN